MKFFDLRNLLDFYRTILNYWQNFKLLTDNDKAAQNQIIWNNSNILVKFARTRNNMTQRSNYLPQRAEILTQQPNLLPQWAKNTVKNNINLRKDSVRSCAILTDIFADIDIPDNKKTNQLCMLLTLHPTNFGFFPLS